MTIKEKAILKPNASRYMDKFGTQFSIPQSHRNSKGEVVQDGFISLVALGEYPFERGDRIRVLKLNGATLRKASNGLPYFTVYADVELIKETYRPIKGQRDIKKLGGDIPEELL